MLTLNKGVLISLAVCAAATQALGLSYLPKQQGRPAMQRRRLRKHKNEVVQLPKAGERRKGSKKNSYKPDESDYPAYLSGFYGYDEQLAETPGEGTHLPGTNEPTYSPTYDYFSAQPGDDDGASDNDNGDNGYYYVDQPAQQSFQPQPQPQLYSSKADEYSTEEVVYTYTGELSKQGKKGAKEAKGGTKGAKEAKGDTKDAKEAKGSTKGTKEVKNDGKKSANKGSTTKYKAVKGDKSKGKKGSYYVYGVEEEIQPDGIQDVIIDEEYVDSGETYANAYDQGSGEARDGLLGTTSDNDLEELHAPVEQTYSPAAKEPVPAAYAYVLPPKGSKSKKENSRSKSTVFEGTYYPVTKGLKGLNGEQLHSRSKSSSCKGKGKGKGGAYDPETMEAIDECTSDSKKLSKKKSSGKKSKSTGKSMLILPPFTSFPTFVGNGTAPIPFGEMTAVPSSSPLDGDDDYPSTLIPVDAEPSTGGQTPGSPATMAPTMSIKVDFLTFGLLYDISRADIPPAEDYAAAAVVSGMCISNYFSMVFGPEAESIYLSSELDAGSTAYSLLSGAISDYNGNALFSDAGTIPTPDDLDVSLEGAFTGAALDACMELFRTELPPENLFSTVINIRKVEPSTTMANARRRRPTSSSFSLQKGIFMVTAFGMVGILLYVGGRMWLGSRRKRPVVQKGGAYFGGDDIIMGDHLNGYLVDR